ncbi:VOC family protein, partial [Pantoea sp. SIMBA_133]
MFTKVHHVAIICSNYERSKHFYTNTLGLSIIEETYRKERNSYKLDLAVG